MVEFAIVLPLLLLLVLGIFYFSEFLNYANDETQLAAEAARWASVDTDPSSSQTLQNYVLSLASPGLQSASTDVPTPAKVYIYYPAGSSGAVGESVRACVTATVHFIPFLGFTNTTITETATMRLEQTATNWTPDSSPPSACPTS
jgi:Flp pilus assembly protein TadG